jgi:hypothetical protein
MVAMMSSPKAKLEVTSQLRSRLPLVWRLHFISGSDKKRQPPWFAAAAILENQLERQRQASKLILYGKLTLPHGLRGTVSRGNNEVAPRYISATES